MHPLCLLLAALTSTALAASRYYNTGRNVVYLENINFSSANVVHSRSWEAVHSLTRTINVDRPLAAAMIDYTIPMTCIVAGRARIRLRVNGKFYTDATVYSGRNEWLCKQIHLDAVIPNVQAGPLLIEILAMSEEGNLNLPAGAMIPQNPLFGTLTMVGLTGATAPPLTVEQNLPPGVTAPLSTMEQNLPPCDG